MTPQHDDSDGVVKDALTDNERYWPVPGPTGRELATRGYVTVRADDVLHLLGVYIENGMVEDDDEAIVNRLFATVAQWHPKGTRERDRLGNESSVTH